MKKVHIYSILGLTGWAISLGLPIYNLQRLFKIADHNQKCLEKDFKPFI